MLIVQEMARIDFVDGDRPERRVVVIAKVFLLTLGWPRWIYVGEVIVRAGRLGFEWPGSPHARKRPPVEIWRRRHRDRLAGRQRDDGLALEKRGQLLQLLTSDCDQLPRFGVCRLGAGPGLQRVAAVHPSSQGLERFL